ncbi:hypothetical protein OM416_16365 [Paenibacillus sp. LS1]|uniref:Blp family class II bacteriocin n=1 Tax=Paenibacillus sp. LS1 TaxID=2992120 RepID=UPI0022312CDE|nr:hypothetical protein [Paenibacillus sp. LS1]MCW3793165.1 hypothetical protein [Paenibacillus sp. LS1]
MNELTINNQAFEAVDMDELFDISGGGYWGGLVSQTLGYAATGAGIGNAVGRIPNPALPVTVVGGTIGGAIIGGATGAALYIFG